MRPSPWIRPGCQGPGHIVFADQSALIYASNTSGQFFVSQLVSAGNPGWWPAVATGPLGGAHISHHLQDAGDLGHLLTCP
ncbi:MAG: hypothetical protein H6707_04080 [Deltaproteobacteria bacterium]|nr:hypothetical protein [Deltaproteobacteria bacterium]